MRKQYGNPDSHPFFQCLPASPRYFFQSFFRFLPCPSVITFSQFVASFIHSHFFARCHILSLLFFLIVSLLFFFNFFTDSYRIFPIQCHLFYSFHVHQLSNSKFLLVFLCFFFFSFHPSFPLSPNFRTVAQYSTLPSKYINIVFPEFSVNSKVFFSFHLSARLFAIRFQAASFSCCLSSSGSSGSARWRPLIDGTRYYSIGRPSASSLLLPLTEKNYNYSE